MKIILSILLFTAFFFYSCTTEEPVVQAAAEPAAAEQPPEEQVTEPEPAAEPAEAAEETPAESDENYVVSREVYEQTFEEIEAFIKELNQVISRKQYDRWLTYLSTGYTRKYNSPEVLNEINEYPQLKDNGIVLKNLKDYFDWVVVPSRSRAVLGDIVFVDEAKVIAYSSFDGKRAKLYQLEKNDGKWKITVWD